MYLPTTIAKQRDFFEGMRIFEKYLSLSKIDLFASLNVSCGDLLSARPHAGGRTNNNGLKASCRAYSFLFRLSMN